MRIADLDTEKPLVGMGGAGVTPASGAPLARRATMRLRSICRRARAAPPSCSSTNFKVILKYNNAASYALAVGMLADRMAGGAAIGRQAGRATNARCRAPNACGSRPI